MICLFCVSNRFCVQHLVVLNCLKLFLYSMHKWSIIRLLGKMHCRVQLNNCNYKLMHILLCQIIASMIKGSISDRFSVRILCYDAVPICLQDFNPLHGYCKGKSWTIFCFDKLSTCNVACTSAKGYYHVKESGLGEGCENQTYKSQKWAIWCWSAWSYIFVSLRMLIQPYCV